MQNAILKITGMNCNGCTSKVAQVLKAIPGVHDVVVSLEAGEAAVRYDEHLTTLDQLKSEVKSVGYGVDVTPTAHGHQGKGCCCG